MKPTASTWSVGQTHLGLDNGILMGILNVTPDSFSDGGQFFAPEVAVGHGLGMVEDGAAVVDVGGESTRPGADPVPLDQELERVIPVIGQLANRGIAVSIDTHKPDVAAAALAAGAIVINDVTGFTNPDMIDVAARSECGVVIMHGREEPLIELPDEVDPVGVVVRFLADRADDLARAGITRDRMVVDPGIGFAKTPDQSVALLAGVDRIAALGLPVLVGTSRKSFLMQVLGESDWESRDNATAATTALAFLRGARLFRIHDVAKSRDALRVAAAIVAHH